MRALVATALGLVVSLLVSSSHAEPPDLDTAYGRIDGDLSASLAVGATFGPRSPRAAADLRLRYLWTAGIFATYEDGPLASASSEPRRVFAAGLELRPLFLAKWLQGKELGQPQLDLAIDSFGLELGAVFEQPTGASFASKPGLQASLGLQLPVLPRVSGPVIGVHAGCRWSNELLSGGAIGGPDDRSLFLLLSVGWQQAFGGHLVDLGDRAPR